jgi:ribosome-associated protein
MTNNETPIPAIETPVVGLVVTRTFVIPEDELLWRYSASGGPGGQHANTSNTKAEVVWDITTSQAGTQSQRDRLVGKLGDVVRIASSDERSQLRNKQHAERRLKQRVVEALKVEKPRRPTKPSKGAIERRLKAKSVTSQRKSTRQRPASDD